MKSIRLTSTRALLGVAVCGLVSLAGDSPFGSAPALAQSSDRTLTVYIVRHADRGASEGWRTHLSESGTQRAIELAKIADERGVTDVYGTDTCRTLETVAPAAVRRDPLRPLKIGVIRLRQVLDESPCHLTISEYVSDALGLGSSAAGIRPMAEYARSTGGKPYETRDFVQALLGRLIGPDQIILMAHHSNWVPKIVELLTNIDLCSGDKNLAGTVRRQGECMIDGSVYSYLFEVELRPNVAPRFSCWRYGEPDDLSAQDSDEVCPAYMVE